LFEELAWAARSHIYEGVKNGDARRMMTDLAFGEAFERQFDLAVKKARSLRKTTVCLCFPQGLSRNALAEVVQNPSDACFVVGQDGSLTITLPLLEREHSLCLGRKKGIDSVLLTEQAAALLEPSDIVIVGEGAGTIYHSERLSKTQIYPVPGEAAPQRVFLLGERPTTLVGPVERISAPLIFAFLIKRFGPEEVSLEPLVCRLAEITPDESDFDPRVDLAHPLSLLFRAAATALSGREADLLLSFLFEKDAIDFVSYLIEERL